MSTKKLISIAILAPIEGLLTYSVPDSLQEKINPGQRVMVPLGRRKAVGIVMGEEKNPPLLSYKPIESILDEEPTFTSSQLEFMKWAADYYLAPIGEMMKVALPGMLTHAKSKKFGVKTLNSEFPTPNSELTLTAAQQKIVNSILPPANDKSFTVHLLHGVTGSGKTEVYLECIRRTLSQGKQAICLVPEIGLTPQTLSRYQEQFGNQVGAYHSGLSEGERLRIWESCRKGELSVLIGTRSALFAPFQKLGLIVVDEEQDSSYKQEERVRYHARDLAIVRAKIEKIPIILGSATPSVEFYYKAKNKKFFYHELSERFGKAQLPKVEIVDLRWEKENTQDLPLPTTPYKGEEKKKKFSLLSPRLMEEISLNLDRQEQTLIFLNRRGFSHFLLCEDCGNTPNCPNCEITLTFHRRSKKLICHYCDYHDSPPEVCSTCQGLHWLPIGSGTEKIEDELKEQFPQAKIFRMDRDTTSRKGSHQTLLQKLADREVDILVGTQMIAKGHDYPGVTLVGILLADATLHHPDFRAAEQTFQLITQVSGRAGRAEIPGRVILQTFLPEHSSIEAAARHQVKEFYEEELNARKELGYPPFRRLMVLRIQGTQQTKVQKGIEKLEKILQSMKENQKFEIEILGPSPCLIEKLRNLYRWQILIKSDVMRSLQPWIRREILETKSKWLLPGLRLIVDVDPVHVV
jgi:primosomal protein N' (replication factor Y)